MLREGQRAGVIPRSDARLHATLTIGDVSLVLFALLARYHLDTTPSSALSRQRRGLYSGHGVTTHKAMRGALITLYWEYTDSIRSLMNGSQYEETDQADRDRFERGRATQTRPTIKRFSRKRYYVQSICHVSSAKPYGLADELILTCSEI